MKTINTLIDEVGGEDEAIRITGRTLKQVRRWLNGARVDPAILFLLNHEAEQIELYRQLKERLTEGQRLNLHL